MLESLTSLDAQQEKWQDSSQVPDNFLSLTTTWSKNLGFGQLIASNEILFYLEIPQWV